MPRPPRQRPWARPSARRARAPQDGSYKHLFSQPKMVEGLVRDFVHEDWLALPPGGVSVAEHTSN